MIPRHFKGLPILFAILCASNAQAIPMLTSGIWNLIEEGNSPPPVANVSGLNTNEIAWGNPFPAGATTPPSGYIFDGVNVDAPLDGPLFPLGDFTHVNFSIFLPSISGANLDVTLDIPDEGTSENFMFFFNHDETPNSLPCDPSGATVCPDLVTIPDASSTNTISIMGMEFILAIEGFSEDGGTTITDGFITEEGQNNTATLFARLEEVVVQQPVPEPTTLSLIGFGLALSGLGFVRRRRVSVRMAQGG